MGSSPNPVLRPPARVLWMSNDPWFLEPYMEELEGGGASVDLHDCADDVAPMLRGDPCRHDVVLWDLPLRKSRLFAREATRGGLVEGWFFFREFNRSHPNVPTLLFTLFRRVAATWCAPGLRRYALAQQDVLADEFARGVFGILATQQHRGSQ